MLFTDTTQYLILALVLVAGWLFGLASHPGGRRWKARYEKERADHNAYRTDADGRVRDYDRRAVEAETRVRTLEAELNTARNQRPYVADAARTPDRKPVYISDRETRPDARATSGQRGWFDFAR